MTVSQDLKKAGLKMTMPRMRILEFLESSQNRHVSAEEIYQILKDTGEDVGLATVYRVLTQFETAGLVMRHKFEDGRSVYELDHGEHHDHILCVQCGRVDEFIDETIEQRQRAIAEKTGYAMTDHALYIYGVCPQCQEKSTK